MQPDKEKLIKHPSYEDVYLDEKRLWWRLIINDEDEEELKRTYPSWEKLRVREIISPGSKDALPMTKELHRLGQMLMTQLSQNGADWEGGVRRKKMTDALAKVRGKDRGNLKALMKLWRCGLVIREGEVFGVNKRPFNQKWSLDADKLRGAYR